MASAKAERNTKQEPEPGIAWFCLRTQWKHEHIAAGHLRQIEGVEVFNPRLRFQRTTRCRQVWVTEPMFPNYLFARFDWKHLLNRVNYAPNVTGVVHFGTRWPTVPDSVLETLRAFLGPEEVQMISKDFKPGEKVELVGGAFHGLEAVVTQVMPGKQRVSVLMDFLGRQTTVEITTRSILKMVRG